MILKAIKTETFKIDDKEIDNKKYEQIHFYADLKYVNRSLPLEHADGLADSLTLKFNDGSEMLLAIAVLVKDVWEYEYKSIFLMNDKGETIERIL